MKTMTQHPGLEGYEPGIMINRENIGNLSRMLNFTILTDRDWIEFKQMFEQVHRYFFAALKVRHPDLTQSEVRIAALIKLNLTTREMADMLAISAESANKARYRLRKKLNLQPEQSLTEFIENVSASLSFHYSGV